MSTIIYGISLLSQIKKGFMYKTVRLGMIYAIMVNTIHNDIICSKIF